jgi:hypothetical protein
LNRQRVPGERRIYGEELAAGQEEYVSFLLLLLAQLHPLNACLFRDLFQNRGGIEEIGLGMVPLDALFRCGEY